MKHVLAAMSFALLTNMATAQLTCTVTPCGESCGATLTVTYTPRANGNYRIDLTGAGLHPNALLGLYWGDGPQSIPLPYGPGCSLLIHPIWGTFHTTDSTGSFTWGRNWPHWATAQFYMQMGTLWVDGNGTIETRSTNCKIGACW